MNMPQLKIMGTSQLSIKRKRKRLPKKASAEMTDRLELSGQDVKAEVIKKKMFQQKVT